MTTSIAQKLNVPSTRIAALAETMGISVDELNAFLEQGAAQEYGPTIRVNCVSPGLIRTPMSEALFKIPGILDPVLKSTPLERTGTAEEVADAIAFLASDRARFITGQNLVIDGGMGLAQAGIDETLRKLLEMMKGAKR